MSLRFLALGLNALIFAWAARRLPPADMGAWALATALTSIVMSADLGLSVRLRNLLTQSTDDREGLFLRATALCSLLASGYAVVLAGVGFVAVAASPTARSLFSDQPVLGWSIVVAGSLLLLRLPFNLAANSFYSFGEPGTPMFWEFVGFALSFVFVVVVLGEGLGAIAAVAAYLLGGNIATLGSFIHFLHRRRWRFVWCRPWDSWPILRSAWSFGVLQLIGLGLTNLPTFAVGGMARLEDVTVSRAAMMLCQTILALHLAHTMPIWTAFAQLAGRHDAIAGRQQLEKRLARETGLLTIAFVVLAVLAPHGINLWLGTHRDVTVLSTAFCAWGWCCGVANLYSLILNGGNRPLLTAAALVPGILLAAATALPLSRWLGSLGVAIAFASGALLTALLMFLLAKRVMRALNAS